MTFSQNLKAIRVSHKYSQKVIAALLGVTQEQYSRWETGSFSTPIEVYKTLADIYQTSIDELCGYTSVNQHTVKAVELSNEEAVLRQFKVGDVVKVKALCEVVDSYYCQRLDKESCPFASECKHIICESCNESEFTTRISSIQNCGDGWRIYFDNMLVEARPFDYGKSFWKIGDGPKLETFCLRDQVDFLKRFIRGEWVDCFIIQKLLDIDFSTGLQMFEFSRTAQWNPEPYNGQKVRTCFRIKSMKEDPAT